MRAQLDELYFTWLYSQVHSLKVRSPSRTYNGLLRQLYQREFVWFVPNDDNRLEDGRDLRREFIVSSEIYEVDPEWMGLGCSMLEMLVALSRRLSFEDEGEPRRWFWHLLENLDLSKFNDRCYDREASEEIDEVIDRVIWRRYSPNGHGGLFPLREPNRNQRDVEIWYQLNAYLLERD